MINENTSSHSWLESKREDTIIIWIRVNSSAVLLYSHTAAYGKDWSGFGFDADGLVLPTDYLQLKEVKGGQGQVGQSDRNIFVQVNTGYKKRGDGETCQTSRVTDLYCTYSNKSWHFLLILHAANTIDFMFLIVRTCRWPSWKGLTIEKPSE